MTQHESKTESEIGYRLKQAQTVLRARMDDALRPLGLSTPQYACLEAISQHPGASNSEIARAVFVTRQTMNTLLRGLEQRGLVARAARAETGRSLPTRLTSEGEHLLTEATARSHRINQAIADALTPELDAALRNGLSRCIEALEELSVRGD